MCTCLLVLLKYHHSLGVDQYVMKLKHLYVLFHIQVFSHLDNLIFEGDVVPEHWLPYSSNQSMDEYSRFSGASQETVKQNPYPIEFVDYGAAYYRQYYLDQGQFISVYNKCILCDGFP